MIQSKKWQAFFGIIFSAICWYLAFDLSLHAWWALWLAPVPVLYLSMRVSGWQAYGLAFLTMLIGRLSWFSFLHAVLPIGVVVIVSVVLPLLFGLIILAVRKIVAVAPPIVAVLAYPVLWTALEFLQFLFSRDGTNGSIAYTQSDFLPLVQIASLTGVLGITFLVCLFASAIALGWYFHQQGRKIRGLMLSVAIPLALALSFGLIRLSGGSTQKEVTVGLAAIPMSSYHRSVYDRSPEATLSIAHLYLQQVRSLCAKGAQIVLLPEKGIAVSDSTEPEVRAMFLDEARRSGVTIVMGVNSLHADSLECQAWVLSPEGHLLLNYRKVHLFEGETADGFVPGKAPGFFPLDGALAGVAICKDLDFERYSSLYRQMGASILYVPAWDFVRDGWAHSRIALMGAVENGYSLVRNAQQGRLTISDDRGRVRGEASSEGNDGAFLIGKIGLSSGPTLYSRWGDWFGWLNLLAGAGILFLAMARKRKAE